MYEFDYPPVTEESERRQLVHIEVKFSSVIALQSSTEEVIHCVTQSDPLMERPRITDHLGTTLGRDEEPEPETGKNQSHLKYSARFAEAGAKCTRNVILLKVYPASNILHVVTNT